MNISDISLQENKDPFDWLIDNALSEYGIDDLFIAELLNADDNEVKKLILHDKSTVSLSDAGAHLSLLCDAGYGLDLLGKWSRDLNIMSLEQAVYKLSGNKQIYAEFLKEVNYYQVIMQICFYLTLMKLVFLNHLEKMIFLEGLQD